MTGPDIFVVSTGVSGNLGDAVIRRRVLRWVEGLGRRHVYVGSTTSGWVEQLQLAEDDLVYHGSSRRTWLRHLLTGGGPRVLVYDPGEVPLGRAHLRSEVVFLLMAIVLRLRGAYVVRPPRAVAHVDPLTAALHRLSCRLSQVVLWRDADSHAVMRCGTLVPDTAFDEQPGPDVDAPRDRLTVSLRGKRDLPPPAFFEALSSYAAQRGLKITVLTQVDEDEARSQELAARFAAAELVPWGDDSDLARERQVREFYGRTHTVISDRLHVLLLAAQAGAAPREVVSSPRSKVRTHFGTAGIGGISLDINGLDAEEIYDFLVGRERGADDDQHCLDQARNRLEDEVLRLRTNISTLG